MVTPCPAAECPMLLSPARLCRLLLSLLASVWLSAAQADEWLTQQIEDFLHQQLQAQGLAGTVEVRPGHAMPPCEAAEPFLPQPGQRLLGQVAVGVRCRGGQTRYLQAQISVLADYLVVNRVVAIGETLQPELLEWRQGPLERLPRQFIQDPADALGKQALRPLEPEVPLQPRNLRAPRLVERNARVSIEVLGRGFHIRREGVALEPGALGSEIRVRADNGEVLRARVIDRNRLQVQP